MSCSHNYNNVGDIGMPRMILCQSEKLRVIPSCPDPIYEWSPGMQTTQEIDLDDGVNVSVEVDCGSCGGAESEGYCFPIVKSSCNAWGVFIAPCAESGSGEYISFQDEYQIVHTCSGDAIDWTTIAFNYTHVPAGITLDYGGAPNRISAEVNLSIVKPGTYYVPTRVFTASGVPSNWWLTRVTIGGDGNNIGASDYLDPTDDLWGDCCKD